MTITPDDILAEQRLCRGPRARGRRPAARSARCSGAAPAWAARSSSASSATRRPARRRSPAGSSACSARSNVTHVCVDDYHRYDRRQRAERNITPLDPDCNYMDIMAQHLAHMRSAEPILKPVYQHHDGTFGPPVRVEPEAVLGRRGAARLLHRGAAAALRRAHLPDPPEELRRHWKVQRDCSRRGYTTDQVLSRARPARARLRGLHPAPAALRRHRRLVPAERRRRPGAPRRRARPAADRCSTPTSARCSTARQRATPDPDHRGATASCTCTSPAGSSASAPRRSRR